MGRKLTAFLLVVTMLLCNGCSLVVGVKKDPLPEETIEAFETAVNDMDVEAMMECMDPKAVKAMTAGMDVVMKLAGGLTGIDLGLSAEDLISMMPLMQGITAAYGEELAYPQVDFQVTETYIKDDKATVYFTEVNSGEAAAINMDLVDGKWVMTLDLKPIAPEDADRVIIAGQEMNTEQQSEDSGVYEISGTLNLAEVIESFSVTDLLSQEKIEALLRTLLSPES